MRLQFLQFHQKPLSPETGYTDRTSDTKNTLSVGEIT